MLFRSDAAAAAKKLKDYTLGIDELNIIKPDTGAGASGGSGAAGGAGWEKDWDLDSVWDKSVLENITRQVDGLKEKIKDILVPIGLVTGAFLAWKIAPYLLVGLRTVYELLGLILGRQLVVSAVTSKFLAILKSLAVFAGFAGAAVAIYGVIDAFQSGNVTWANTAMILGGVAAAAIALGIAINPLVGAITLVVGGVAAFVTAIHDMLTGEVTPQNITLALGGVAAAAIGVGLAFGPIPALIVAILSYSSISRFTTEETFRFPVTVAEADTASPLYAVTIKLSAYSPYAVPQSMVMPGITLVNNFENEIVMVGILEKEPSSPLRTSPMYPVSPYGGASGRMIRLLLRSQLLSSNEAYGSTFLSVPSTICGVLEISSDPLSLTDASSCDSGSPTFKITST